MTKTQKKEVKENGYLDSGTIWGCACWATASCLAEASSPLSVLFLTGSEIGGFDGVEWGLWGNSTPALWKDECKNRITQLPSITHVLRDETTEDHLRKNSILQENLSKLYCWIVIAI